MANDEQRAARGAASPLGAPGAGLQLGGPAEGGGKEAGSRSSGRPAQDRQQDAGGNNKSHTASQPAALSNDENNFRRWSRNLR